MTLREELRNQLKIIPKSVMEGGVMTVGLWKAKAERASKLLGQPKATDVEIRAALSELRSFK